MRANVPTDNDFSVANPVEDASPAEKVTREQLELAKIGNSPDWDIIKNYMKGRIDIYKTGLFGEDLTKVSTEIIGQRFLAAQSVVQEFQSLIDEISRNTDAVNEAHSQSNETVR